MPNWVEGPMPLERRRLNIYEGKVGLILRNGLAHSVREPGRHGGLMSVMDDRGLPLTGDLEVLMFTNALDTFGPTAVEVRLRGGGDVTVTVTVSVMPLWQHDPGRIVELVRQYGVDPDSIQSASAAALEHEIRTMVMASLGERTYEEVHFAGDPRHLLTRRPQSEGLLAIGAIMSLTVSRDRHQETIRQAVQQGELHKLEAQIRHVYEAVDAQHTNVLELVRQKGRAAVVQLDRLANVRTDDEVARMLGVSVTDITFSGERLARQKAARDLIEGILVKNPEIIALLDDPGFAKGAELLIRSVLNSVDGERANPPRPAVLPVATAAETDAGLAKLVGMSTLEGPAGPQELLLVEAGPDRVLGGIGRKGPARLVVAAGEDAMSLSQRCVEQAAAWCGFLVRAQPGRRPGSQSEDVLSIVEVSVNGPQHDLADASFGVWIAAINEALDGRVQVTVGADPQ